MKKIIYIVIASGVLLISACGSPSDPPEGCKGHGGVQEIGRDATNSKVPFACKDGTVGRIHL